MMMFTQLKKLAFGLLLTIFTLVGFVGGKITLCATAFAQESNNSNAGLNETQKQIFTEAKKYSNEDKNTLISLGMIAAVLLVVALAMFLAFKSDGGEKKRSFARTPKKEF